MQCIKPKRTIKQYNSLRSMCESAARGVNSSKTSAAAVDHWLATMSAHDTRTGMVGHAAEAFVGQNAELEGDALSDWQPM